MHSLTLYCTGVLWSNVQNISSYFPPSMRLILVCNDVGFFFLKKKKGATKKTLVPFLKVLKLSVYG